MAKKKAAPKQQPKEEQLDKSTFDDWNFVIEADTRRNGDIMLQSIPGLRLRGAIDASKPIIASPNQNAEDFIPMIPADQSRGLSTIPRVPGQRLYVNVKECTYKVTDPLRGDESLRERLAAALREKGMSVRNITGKRDQDGKLDVHRMKTLCRELRCLLEAEDIKEVDQTEVPSTEEIDEYEGRYLLNPGARLQNTQPRFEDEYEDWVGQLSRVGG